MLKNNFARGPHLPRAYPVLSLRGYLSRVRSTFGLEGFFTAQQIVEISYTVGTYYSTGLLTKALKIQPETDGRLTVPGAC
jgi:hypothetical protein